MNERAVALGWPPETERMVVPRRDAVDAPMTDPRQARAARNRQESLDAFLAEKARFDAMVAELQRNRAGHR